jgi:hypothetical protein
MIDAALLGGVVGKGAAGPAELVVEIGAGGECEQPGCDASAEVAWGSDAVALECEEVFAGVEDRVDSLPDWRDVWPMVGLVAADGSSDGGAEGGQGGGEFAAGVALVADDREDVRIVVEL